MEILEKVEQLKAELDSMRPLDTEVEARVMQKLRLDWNYHSNKLEGNTYSYGETKMLLMKGLTAGGKPVRDHEEITGHDQAITFIIESIKDDEPLTEVFIRHLHKLILVRPFWADAKTADGQPTKRLIKVGEYKTEPNHVETQSGAIFRFAEPIETPAKMQELVEWFRGKVDMADTNGIFLAAEFHYRFVRIHPFDDGNGRLARLLMNFVLMKYGFPPVIIKNEDKDNYIAVLEQADFAILEPFIEYIATNLVRSLEIMIRGAKGYDIEDVDDFDKELALLERKIMTDEKSETLLKSPDVLRELATELIIPLIRVFSQTCSKFDRFYLKNEVIGLYLNRLLFNGHSESVLSELDGLLEQLITLPALDVTYNNREFRNPKFGSFDFSSRLRFKFNELTYVVELRADFFETASLYEKPYSEMLSIEEIEDSLKRISKFHRNFIEEKTKTESLNH
jgi:Fic family protein